MARLRILCLTGAWCMRHPQPIWKNLMSALGDAFPEADRTIALEEMSFLHPWQFKRMDAFCDRMVSRHDKGGDILIVGHSMGGVMGYEIAKRFKHTRVVGVATIFSPHTFLWGVFPKMIDTHQQEKISSDIPVISFQAKVDQIVWWGAEHPDAQYHEHVLSDHRFALQFCPRIAHKIARTIRESFCSPALERA